MGKWAIVALLLLACASCSDKLETGYEPKTLDMPLARRRTLYADPFSTEAQEADKAQQESPAINAHNPGGGGY